MPRRWLDPAFFTDEKLAKATIEERLLFTSVIANQDDDGRLLGHPGYLRSIAFPYDDFSIEQVTQMRNHLAEINPNFMIYTVGHSEYIQLRRHTRYQRPRYYHESKYPVPEGWPFTDEQTAGHTEVSSMQFVSKPSDTMPQTDRIEAGNHEDAGRQQSGSPEVTVKNIDGNHAVTMQQPGSNRKDSSRYTEDRVGLDLDLGQDLELGRTIRIPPVSGAQSTEAKTRNKLKPYQQQAGIFLDLVARDEGIKLLTRPKLIHMARQLFTVPGTTPEKLLDFYRLLKRDVPFFRNRSPPQIIAGMLDRFPSWAAGKLVFEKKSVDHKPVDTESKSDPIKAMQDAGWDTGGGEEIDTGK